MPQGSAEVEISANSSALQLGALPLTVAPTGDAQNTKMSVHVSILDPQQANDLTPLGFVFQLDVTDGERTISPNKLLPLELSVDYGRIPLPYGGSVADRLTLYRVSDCQIEIIQPTQQPDKPQREELSHEVLNCTTWQPLSLRNDRANQQLIVDLSVDANANPPDRADFSPEHSHDEDYAPTKNDTPDTALDDSHITIERPRRSNGLIYYVLSSVSSGNQGDYSATPFNVVSDYQVALSSGAFTTNYPIPVPPARAGAAPGVTLSYNSGSIDGMNTRKNTQPGSVGIGWNLQSGAITRHLKGCNNYYYAPGDLCLTGDNYSIVLNGVSSRLVKESGNLYRLQNDPSWKVEMFTDGPTGHPDAQKEYWIVTTPDGTTYRFGGEIVPETGADQDSVFYATIYDTSAASCGNFANDLCDKAWQWNLDRVEDLNGNVSNYFYEQETNYYKARYNASAAFRKQYVRAGHISRIEYTTTSGQTNAPHARVLFNTEMRCSDPTTSGGCDWPSDFPDTPGDLTCEATGSCAHYTPSFWSQRRVGSIQTQVYDQTNSRWQMVAHYNLDQGFPAAPTDSQGDGSEKKLWLGGISQHPGGDFSHWAFTQIEAENYDAQSGIDTQTTLDVGQGENVGWAEDNDYIMFKAVNFDSAATDLVARVSSIYSGRSIEFRLDSTTGPLIATINVPNTGDYQDFETVSATVSSASGIHDLYLVFKGVGMNINWFRFGPHFGSGSPHPGLPAVTYDHEMLTNRRNYNVAGVSPMYMPRIDKVTTELGGVVDITYGQSHACPSTSSSGYIRWAKDCFIDWDSGDPNVSWDDGWVLWHKWKVLSQQTSDSFSGNPTQTLTFDYSAPMWHYNNDPSLPDINSCSYCSTRHWNDFRGSEIVTVTDSSGAKTEHRFYRGMHGDRLTTSGGSYSANITLSDSSTRSDKNWLSGQTAEVRRLDSSSTALTRSVNWFTANNTAGSGIYAAYFVGPQKIEETLYASTNKTTRTEYEYDSYGNVTREIMHGDVSTTADDRNLETNYSYNTADHIVDRPLWQALWSGTTSGGAIGGGGGTSCSTYVSSDVPKYITYSGTPTVTSNLNVSGSGTISDINVLDLKGTHTWINDLDFKLTSPASTQVEIMSQSCGSQNNFDLNLDDEASSGSWPCPPTGGGTYKPSHPLSSFDSENMNGNWTLTVKDHATNDGGYLNGWSLEICTTTSSTPTPTGNELALTMFAYDGTTVGSAPTKGNLTLERAYSQTTTPASYNDTTMAYDSLGRPTSVSDANNNTTTTGYHSFYGYPQSVTNALSHTATTVMDPGWGVVTQVTDANNKVTTVEYDVYGRLTKAWLPTEPTSGPASLEYIYHPEARPAYAQSRQLFDAGSSTYLDSWGYVDGFGREIQSQRPSENSGQRVVSSQQTNNLGQLHYSSAAYQVSGTAGSGYIQPTWSSLDSYQRLSYDDLGRQTLTENMSGSTVLFDSSTTFDGWQSSFYDANNHRTDNLTDAFGQLVQVTEYNDEGSGQVTYTTQYQYNLQGSLTQVTDHLSNTTTMGYDLLGRKTTMSDPDMGSWTYQYDAVGNLSAQQDGMGQWLYLAYDDLNRLSSKRRDTVNGPLVATYTYDTTDKGQLYASQAYDSSGLTVQVETQALNRDDRYRLTEQQWIIANGGTFRMAYGYNAGGSQTSIQYPGNNSGGLGEIVTNHFNSVGQLNQVISGLDNTYFLDSATYKPSGQVATLRLDTGSNGAASSYTYESGTLRLQQKQVTNGSGTTTVQNLSYGYDDASNVTNITDAVNSSQVQSFGYDWLNRLTSASTTSAGTGQYSHTYAYNAIGNITNYNGASYTYSSTQPHAVTAAHGNSYSYDANGNQTSRTIGGTAYTQTFDIQNRLVEVKQGSTTIATFVYDSEGNRVLGTVNGTTTVYIGGVFEYQAGAMTTYYAGPNGPVALRRSSYATSNGIFYMLGDHLGSTSVLLNQDGSTAKQEYYYPFGGNRGSSTFSDITTKRFTGQYHEAGLPGGEGLSYYNARWYDAQLGRFISADALIPFPGNPQSFNRLAYVHNNPLRYTDLTGHRLDQYGDTGGSVTRCVGNLCGVGYAGAIGVASGAAISRPMRNLVGGAANLACGFHDLCDMGNTARRIATGENVGRLEIVATAVPIVPGIVGRWGDDLLSLGARYGGKFAGLIPAGIANEAGQAIGVWKHLPDSVLDKDWAKYQAYVTGVEGMEFSYNGVKFDGVIGALDSTSGQIDNLILLDAKLWGSASTSLVTKLDQEWAQANVLGEARRQLSAVAGTGASIQLHVADAQAADMLRGFFTENTINISVVHTPWQ